MNLEFDEQQITEIFYSWYNGEKVSSLLEELEVEKIPNCSLAKHFPPIALETPCRNCGENLYAFRSNPPHFKKTNALYDISTAHCLNCEHVESETCQCTGCIEILKERNKLIAQHEQERLQKRGIQLENLFNEITPIDSDNIEIEKLIYLYSLCLQSTCEDVCLISPLSASEAPFTPSTEWQRECIMSLLDYIAPLCEDEELLQFNNNGHATWEGDQVSYRIKTGDTNHLDYLEGLLKAIKDRLKRANIEEMSRFIALCERLMICECIDYLRFQRESYHLPHEVGAKTTALFKKLIYNLRTDQIYSVIWRSCREATAYKVKNGLPKHHASNLIISSIDSYVDKATQKNWEIRSYYRDSSKRQSTLSRVIFNKILELDGHGVEHTLQDVITKINSLNKIEKSEESGAQIDMRETSLETESIIK